MVKTLPKLRTRAKTKATIVAEAGLDSPHPAHTQVVAPQCQPIPGPKMVLYCSDCAALDGVAVALRRLRPYMAHVFGSERAPSHRSAFAVLHPRCEKLYNDLLERENWMLHGDLPHSPLISLVYAANCTAHAVVEDGRAMWQICDTIKQLCPDIFLLELGPDFFESKPLRTTAQRFLRALVELWDFAYYVDFRVLDSLKVGEVPATRQRMYLVGVRKCKLLQQWQWPETCPAPKLSQFLEPRAKDAHRMSRPSSGAAQQNLARAMKAIKKAERSAKPSKECFVVDLGTSLNRRVQWAKERVPNMSYQHIKSMWVTHLKDTMTPMELLKCQGYRPEEVEKVVQETSPGVVHEMTGKSCNVNVAEKILAALLPAVGA